MPPETQSIAESTPTIPRRFPVGWTLAFGGLFLLLVMVAAMLNRTQQGPIQIGDTVPTFSIITFDGETINLADHRGKVIVLNFWASWCKPCEQEAADMEAAWQQYRPTGEVLFVGIDYVDTEPEARAYLQKFNITYPNGPDLGTKISQTFRIRGVPETYFIDRQGRLANVQIGPFTSLRQIQNIIDPLLQK